MDFSFGDFSDLPVSRFESMLKTNEIQFFDATEFEEIGQYYIEMANLSMAKKAIEVGLSQHPESTELTLLLVEYYILTNSFDEAIVLLENILSLEPFNEFAHQHMAVILSKRNQHEAAIESLKKGLAYATDKYEFHSLLAMEYLYLDHYFMAKEYFIKCLDEDIRDNHALYNIIYCFESLKDIDGAIVYMNEFLNKDPYNEVAWHQLGRQYVAKKMYEQAITAFDFATICDETFIGAYLELGKALEQLGRYNEAINHYEITLGIDDPTAFALLRIGECHLKLGNETLGLKFLKKAIHEDPLLNKGWIALCTHFMQNKAYAKVLHYVRKAVKIDNTHVRYWRFYAQANKELGLLEEAHNGYESLVNLGNYEVQTWLDWASVLLEMQEYDKGIQALLQGLEFHPDNGRLHYMLAGFYMMQAKGNEASFFLKNAYAINPNDLEVFYESFPTSRTAPLVKNTLSLS
jgi:tetratricopeptide (TPR) repeat protein